MSHQSDVIDAAKVAIQFSMAEGLNKHGETKWRSETSREHLLKAARHLLTQELIDNQEQADDGENHLANAVTRICMAMVNRKRAAAMRELTTLSQEMGLYDAPFTNPLIKSGTPCG